MWVFSIEQERAINLDECGGIKVPSVVNDNRLVFFTSGLDDTLDCKTREAAKAMFVEIVDGLYSDKRTFNFDKHLHEFIKKHGGAK